MKPEGEVTQVSLDNIEELVGVHGPVRFIEHSSVWDDEEHTMIYFGDGFAYLATGFGVGYPGEGPNGLLQVIREHLHRTDITRHHVQCLWKSNDGTVRVILFGQGIGECISTFPGVMDCEFDAEIW